MARSRSAAGAPPVPAAVVLAEMLPGTNAAGRAGRVAGKWYGGFVLRVIICEMGCDCIDTRNREKNYLQHAKVNDHVSSTSKDMVSGRLTVFL